MARYDLGLSSGQFYELTPRQLDALIKRHEREVQRHEFLFGQLTSAVVNFSMGHPKEPTKPRDFMPSEWAKQPGLPKKRKRRNRQAIASGIREAFAHLVKEVKR